LHHVAKKLIANGLPSLLRVFVSIVLPLMSLSCTDGSCAYAVKETSMSAMQQMILLSFIFVHFSSNQVQKYSFSPFGQNVFPYNARDMRAMRPYERRKSV
jgi:hypothetical protein